MKKIILILFAILMAVAVNAQFQVIGVGATGNDATGDPLRTMGIKTNANFSMVQDSFNAALDADDYYWPKIDTGYTHKQLITYDQLMNFQGGGSGVSKDKLQFIIGTTTGAPANGDTILTRTSLIGKEIDFFRGTTADLHKQYFNTTATNGKTGFRFNSTTGTLTVRPAFATGDRCLIEGWNPLNVNWLTFSGGASTLLTGLRAYWNMNETTGTAVNDYLDTYDGTTTAVVGQTGKFGLAEQFISANDDMASFGTTVGDVGTSDFSIACWVYIPDTAKVEYGIMGNWGTTPYYYLSTRDHDYKAMLYWNFGSGAQELVSNAFIPQATWTHIAITVDRSGNALMYVNGTLQTDTEDVSEDVAVAGNNNNTFNIGTIGSNNTAKNANMSIDEPAIWLKVLTQEEITELQTSTIN